MPRKISTLLNVSSKDLDSKGVFDGFVDIDARLHVDPSLLSICKIPEFEKSYEEFQNYFNEILIILSKVQYQGDIFFKAAQKRLIFKEQGSTALGYSKKGVAGNAIGPGLAKQIATTSVTIVKAGLTDPVIFELVPFFEENIGADRISDMTIAILFDNFLEFTQRIANELHAKTFTYTYNNRSYKIPVDKETNSPIVFIPKNLLNNLPLAKSWDDIDKVCKYNSDLRDRVCKIIGFSWKSASLRSKSQIKNVLLDNIDVFKDLIKQYKEKPKSHYDFINDPLGELIWAELSEKAVVEFPVDFSKFKTITSKNILDVVTLICEQYGSLIENNGWFEYLYDNKGNLKPERASQLLFYGIAESYCIANNLDLNRETNAGIGSLDFKVSKGFNAKVNVEIKYTTNPGLIRGFVNQLPAYNRAEKTDYSIYLVIQTSNNQQRIDSLLKLANQRSNSGERIPEIIIIDGRKQLSASKRK